jgi:hemin uptake protein HemP
MPKMNRKSNTPKGTAPPGATPRTEPRTARVLDSKDLLCGSGEVVICHEGRVYRLRRTRLGKLILTA